MNPSNFLYVNYLYNCEPLLAFFDAIRIFSSDFTADTSTKDHSKSNSRLVPLLKSNAVLTIPQIGLSPKLEEVQLAVTRAADYVLMVMNGVAQWSKERLTAVSVLFEGR